MNLNACPDPIARVDEVQKNWPFLDESEVRSIEGRVDRLYRALLAHQVSRSEAARQIHRFIRRDECNPLQPQ